MIPAGELFHHLITYYSNAEAGDTPCPERRRIKVLDFGCGDGTLVRTLSELGYAASGCDVVTRWPDGDPRFSKIDWTPYRLPFEDGSFDFVLSTSVLEHAKNKEDVFREFHRVLRVGGVGLHLYPSKWFLPVEPHVFVPLLNIFWPRCPNWYLALWAIIGIRNRSQAEMTWRQVVRANANYCAEGLSYWSNSRLSALATAVFGNSHFPTESYMRFAGGRSVRLANAVFGGRLGGWFVRTFRHTMLTFEKQTS